MSLKINFQIHIIISLKIPKIVIRDSGGGGGNLQNRIQFSALLISSRILSPISEKKPFVAVPTIIIAKLYKFILNFIDTKFKVFNHSLVPQQTMPTMRCPKSTFPFDSSFAFWILPKMLSQEGGESVRMKLIYMFFNQN